MEIFDIPEQDYLMLYDALLEKRAKIKREEEIGFAYVGKDYQMEDIDHCDFLPDESEARAKYKYYCPICLRYFNVMLTSDCCNNYICHLCIDDLQT